MPAAARASGEMRPWVVVVVQPHGVRAHEPLRQLRERRLEDEAAEGVDLLPVAEVLEEAARVVGPARDLGARAGRGEVGLDAVAQQRELVGREQLADADRAVALELRDQRIVHARLHSALQFQGIGQACHHFTIGSFRPCFFAVATAMS